MRSKVKRQSLTYDIRATGYNYEQIKQGFRSFLIVPDDRLQGYEIDDVMLIQKYSEGEKIDGALITKKIRGMQRNGKGLMKGFIVLSLANWER